MWKDPSSYNYHDLDDWDPNTPASWRLVKRDSTCLCMISLGLVWLKNTRNKPGMYPFFFFYILIYTKYTKT